MQEKILRPVTNAEHSRLTSFEAKLDQLLEKDMNSGDFELLVSVAEVLEEKAIALRLEAAKRGKLTGKKLLKRRHLGVYQGVYLI